MWFDGGPLFPLVAIGVLLRFSAPHRDRSVLTLVLVNVFPARRARDLSAWWRSPPAAGFCSSSGWPAQQLARPEGYQNLMQFIALLRAPSQPCCPATGPPARS